MNESEDRSVKINWLVTNPADPENDDGTHVGGWIRDQMRSHCDKEVALEKNPVGKQKTQVKEGD